VRALVDVLGELLVAMLRIALGSELTARDAPYRA